MTIKPRQITVTKGQRRTLGLIANAHRAKPEPKLVTIRPGSTVVLSGGRVLVNSRTAAKLLSLGLIHTIYGDAGVKSIALTELGWEYAR